MNFSLILLTSTCLFATAGLSCAYLYRRLGLVSVGHGAMLGTGAYTYAILASHGFPFAINVLVTLVSTCVFAAGITCLSERAVGEDYALLTFAIQLMWSGIIANWTALTRGPMGISGLGTGPSFRAFEPLYLWAPLSAILAAASFWAVHRQELGWFPRNTAVVARSSELASTIGLSPLLSRFQVGVVSGALAAGAALLLTLFQTYVSPSSYGIEVGVTILAIGFFALRGNLGRILLGSVLLVLVPQLARFAGLQSSRAGYLQMLIAGAVVCLMAKPSLGRHLEN